MSQCQRDPTLDQEVLHGTALMTLVEATEPDQFQSAAGLAFFEQIRYDIIALALLQQRQTSLTSWPWSVLPWAHADGAKSSMQRLIDLLCQIMPLQSVLPIATLLPDSSAPIEYAPEWVAELLVELRDWQHRLSREWSSPKVTTNLMTWLVPYSPHMSSTIRMVQVTDLYELAIFNMILIYLCRLMAADTSLSQTVGAQILSTTKQNAGETTSNKAVTALILPISDPVARARVAAEDIEQIWTSARLYGMQGRGAKYLELPLLVARLVLLGHDRVAQTNASQRSRGAQ